MAESRHESADIPMLDFYLPMMKAAALVSASQLGLFKMLAEGPLSIQAMAESSHANADGMKTLADFLLTIGYMRKEGEKFALTAYAERWFTDKGRADYTPGLLWTGEAWKIMSTLTEVIIEGGPRYTLWELMKVRPQMGPLFSEYMLAVARHLVPDILEILSLPEGPRRMLDVGGSHGLYSIALCLRYPELHSVIADLPESLKFTGASIKKENLEDRISLLPGDLLEVSLGEEYDLAFYFSVAHNKSPDENREAIKRMYHALNEGGRLVIHEYLAEDPLSQHRAAFRLTLLTETGTRIYSLPELSEWLQEAGFGNVTVTELVPRDKGALIVATK